MTAGDVAALVAAAVDMARENAESFARLGLAAPGDENGGDGGANATAAVELLDRVQATLAASRVDFAAALEASRAREKNATADATTVLGPDEFIALIRGATGLPFGGDGAAPGPDAPFDYARLLASLDARDDTASLERVVEIFERDPLGILNLGGGGGSAAGPEDLPGDGGGAPGVAVLSGPPAIETRDGSDDVVRLDPREVEGTVAPSGRAENPNERRRFSNASRRASRSRRGGRPRERRRPRAILEPRWFWWFFRFPRPFVPVAARGAARRETPRGGGPAEGSSTGADARAGAGGSSPPAAASSGARPRPPRSTSAAAAAGSTAARPRRIRSRRTRSGVRPRRGRSERRSGGSPARRKSPPKTPSPKPGAGERREEDSSRASRGG